MAPITPSRPTSENTNRPVIKSFGATDGVYSCPYRDLCTIEVVKEPGWEILLDEYEETLLTDRPHLTRFFQEELRDIQGTVVRRYYCPPEHLAFTPN
jgi:hypothetical protein